MCLQQALRTQTHASKALRCSHPIPQVIAEIKKEGGAWVSKYARGGSARKQAARKMYIVVSRVDNQGRHARIIHSKGAESRHARCCLARIAVCSNNAH